MWVDLSHLMAEVGVEEEYRNLTLGVKDDTQVRELQNVYVVLRSTGEAVQIVARYNVQAVLRCSRCLCEFETCEQGQLEEFFELVHGAEGPHGEVDWLPSEEDRDIFRGKNLDLTELLRQNAVVNFPMAPVCRKDCLGLCPVCGENKNLGACRCDRQPGVKETAIQKAFRKAGLR